MLGLFVVLLLAGFTPGSGTAHAQDRVLTVSIGPEVRRFTAAQLLDRPDAVELTIPADVSYGRPMKYRAVPLLPLVIVGPAFDTIEARAADGFVSQIPLALVAKGASGGSKAWIAIEDARRSVARSSGQAGKRRPVLSGVGEPGTLCCRQRAVALSARLAHGSRVSGAPLAADGGGCEPARATRQRGAVRQFSRPSACPAIA